MAKILLLLGLVSFCFLASSKIYNGFLSCGPCVTQTSCTGSKCYFLTGDITGEYCTGGDVCTISMVKNVTLGSCTVDLSGQNCNSGVCMTGVNTEFCYSPPGGCVSGSTFSQICADGKVDIQLNANNTVNSMTYNLGGACPFTNVTGTFNTCTADSFGISCSCCASYNIYGANTAIGSCIPSSIPLASVRNSLYGQSLALLSSALLFMLAFLY